MYLGRFALTGAVQGGDRKIHRRKKATGLLWV